MAKNTKKFTEKEVIGIARKAFEEGVSAGRMFEDGDEGLQAALAQWYTSDTQWELEEEK